MATILVTVVVWAAPVAGNVWEDPDFLDRFTATYGFRGEQEPTVTREEQELLREVASRMPESPEEAAGLLLNAIDQDASAALDFTLGNLRFQLEELSMSAGHYRDAIEKFPGFLRAHKNLGLVLARQGEYGEAVGSLARALALGSTDSDTYGLLGYAHFEREHWVSAEAAYRQALLFEPENANWQVGLARTLQEQERHREANDLLTELTHRFPDHSGYWLYQANSYMQLDRPMEAASNIELVRRMNGATPDSLLLLGDIYTNEEIPAPALEAYEAALQDGEAVPLARLLRAADRLSRRGHHTEAERLAAVIEERAPDDLPGPEQAALLRLRSRLALNDGDRGQAVRLLEQALEAAPLDGQTLIELGKRVAPENLERAELLFERAARRPEVAPEALRRRGEILVRNGRYGEALEFLRQAQEIEPRDTLRRYIERVERLTENEQ